MQNEEFLEDESSKEQHFSDTDSSELEASYDEEVAKNHGFTVDQKNEEQKQQIDEAQYDKQSNNLRFLESMNQLQMSSK